MPIVLRQTKGTPLTVAEVDGNFTYLSSNLDLKANIASPTFTGTVTLPNSLVQVTASTYPTIRPTLNLDFANSKTVDPRITFVRNSTATYYDGQTTAKAEENLFKYSQGTFNTPSSYWAPSGNMGIGGGVVDNNAIAPDGTTTASTVINNGTDIYIRRVVYNTPILLANTTYTMSLWVKKVAGTGVFCFYTGPTGVSGSSTATTSWDRYTFVFTPSTTTSDIRIFQSYIGSAIGDTFQIWGAQLEQRSTVTAYTPTTTATITNYIPVLMTAPTGVPRLDYNPTTGQALGLLIEESRTNLLVYSSDFSNAIWSKNASTITADTIVAPDGTLTGDKLVENTASAQHYITGISSTLATTSTFSCYAKAGERSRIQIGSYIQTYCIFNLSSQTTTITNAFGWPTATATITLVGNGWYRCTFTVGTGGSAYNPAFAIGIVDNSGNVSYTGDGYSGIYIWGAQLEVGAFATSYIPTVASTVTRAADLASMTGTNFSSWYNQSEGSLYAESNSFSNTSNSIANLGDNGLGVEGIDIRTPFGYGAIYRVNAVNNIYADTSGVVNTFYKQAISSKAFSHNYSNNSANQYTINLGQPSTISRLEIGNRFGSLFLNGHIRKLSYYPIALSSSELVALTS